MDTKQCRKWERQQKRCIRKDKICWNTCTIFIDTEEKVSNTKKRMIYKTSGSFSVKVFRWTAHFFQCLLLSTDSLTVWPLTYFHRGSLGEDPLPFWMRPPGPQDRRAPALQHLIDDHAGHRLPLDFLPPSLPKSGRISGKHRDLVLTSARGQLPGALLSSRADSLPLCV